MASKRAAEEEAADRPAKRAKSNDHGAHSSLHAVASGVNVFVADVMASKAWYINVLEASNLLDLESEHVLLRLPGGAMLSLRHGTPNTGASPATDATAASIFIGVANIDEAIAVFESRASGKKATRAEWNGEAVATFTDLDGNLLCFSQIGGRPTSDSSTPWTMEFLPARQPIATYPLISIRRVTHETLIADFIRLAFTITWRLIETEALVCAGAPVAVYYGVKTPAGEWDIEVGFPIVPKAKLAPELHVGDIAVGTRTVLPAGFGVVAIMRGHYEHLKEAWPMFIKYAKATTEAPAVGGCVWEEYQNDPSEVKDPKLWATKLFWPAGAV